MASRIQAASYLLGSFMSFAILSAITSCSLFVVCSAQAQTLSEQREQARNEVRPLYFNKFVSIDARLTEATGPDQWQKLFGKPLVGCPIQPLLSPDSLNLEFTTSGGQAWAGDLDGLNVKVNSITGFPGGALAMPSNSTAKAPDSDSGPVLSFFFDQTSNVARATIDRIAKEIDECFSKLPAGNYPGDTIAKLCPYPEIPLANFKQTCVVNTYGDIGESIPDGSGYKVRVHEQLMCDGVGYGRAQPTNSGWLSCYVNTYEGVARITAEQDGTRITSLRTAARRALRSCSTRAGAKNSRRRMSQCAAKSITQSLGALNR